MPSLPPSLSLLRLLPLISPPQPMRATNRFRFPPPPPSLLSPPPLQPTNSTCHCFHRHCLCTTSALRMPSLPPSLSLLQLLPLISPPQPMRAINRFRFPHHHRLCCRRPCLIAATSIFKKWGGYCCNHHDRNVYLYRHCFCRMTAAALPSPLDVAATKRWEAAPANKAQILLPKANLTTSTAAAAASTADLTALNPLPTPLTAVSAFLQPHSP